MGQPKNKYKFIKDLVFDHVHRTAGTVDYEALTAEVKQHFPESRWQYSHWAWYRYQMTQGRFADLLSDEEKLNLGIKGRRSKAPSATKVGSTQAARGPGPKDDKVKSLADPILDHVRFVIGLAAGEDQVLKFKINRWIFARLLQDEIRVKRPIKKALWEAGQTSCQVCGKKFDSLKGVEIHRKDSAQGYSESNCLLICRECHQKHPDFA